MKEKYIPFLKNIGYLLLIVMLTAISFRFFTVVRTISSDKMINEALLPDTFRENVKWEVVKIRIKMLKEQFNKVWEEIDNTKKLIQELEKKSQPQQLKEVLSYKGKYSFFLMSFLKSKPGLRNSKTTNSPQLCSPRTTFFMYSDIIICSSINKYR